MRHPELLEILDAIHYATAGQEVFLYGSQARGDATEESDIDLMVFDTSLYTSLLPFLRQLEKQYQVPICLQYGDRYLLHTGKTAFWRSLRKEVILIQDFLENNSN